MHAYEASTVLPPSTQVAQGFATIGNKLADLDVYAFENAWRWRRGGTTMTAQVVTISSFVGAHPCEYSWGV
jgi:hypothetical protein